MNVTYQQEPDLSVDEFMVILERSTLAERRPMNEPGTLQEMLHHADVILTARAGRILVGISRAVTDFSYCTYLADLAVDRTYQCRGIGRELIRRTHEVSGLHTTLILLAAPQAQSYYAHIGMQQHPSCWTMARQPRTS